MQSIKGIFWNSDQHRLRALWRLIGQLVIFVIVVILIEGTVGMVAVGMLIAQEDVSLEQLSDPGVVQAFIMENPLPMMLANVGVMVSLTLSIALAGRFLDRRRFADFGLHIDRAWWIDFAFGLALGAILIALIFLVELAAGWVTVTDTLVTKDPNVRFLSAIWLPLFSFLAVGFYEELFSRGYQLQNLAEGLVGDRLSPQAAIVIATLLSSAVFGALHAGNPNATLFSTWNITLAGIFLATGYLLTGELAIPIAVHITWNFFQGNVFGFPVSGTAVRAATFISIEQGGPDVWTGGAFGPEAGLLGLGAMILGILLTVLWVDWRYGEADLALGLAAPPHRDGQTG